MTTLEKQEDAVEQAVMQAIILAETGKHRSQADPRLTNESFQNYYSQMTGTSVKLSL